jgi:hypothetical protein
VVLAGSYRIKTVPVVPEVSIVPIVRRDYADKEL